MSDGEEGSLSFENVKLLNGLMNQEITWFVETPVVLELNDGFVKQILLREDLKRMRSVDSSRALLFGHVTPLEMAK